MNFKSALYKNRKSLMASSLVLCVAGLGAAFMNASDGVNTEPSVPLQELRSPVSRAEEESISPREAAIRNYHDFPDKFPSAVFGDRTFHLVTFPQSYGKQKNFPNERSGIRSGLVVFGEDDRQVWESTEFIDQIVDYTSSFKDLTGDGVPEVIAVDVASGNVMACVMFIYKWNGVAFDLITPEPPEYAESCNGPYVGAAGPMDIDGDGVFELVTFTSERVHPELDFDDPRYDEEEEFKLIYKFNGTKYVLWKKIPLPTKD